MSRSDEIAREIADIDARLEQLPPEERDDHADLLERRRELAAQAADQLAGERPTRGVEPEGDVSSPDPDLEAGG